MKKSLIALLMGAGMITAASAQTSSIINTDFKAIEGYSDGTIVGKPTASPKWEHVENTAPNAFEITDSAGDGYADQTLTIDDFGTNNLGQYVYLDATSAGNEVDDEWSGIMDFKLELNDAFAGAPVTLTRTKIFNIGLSTVNSNNLRDVHLEDAFVTVKTDNDGSLQFQFNGSDNMVVLPVEDTGWDPEDGLGGGADFVTDDLRLSWTMRKTANEGVYGAWASIENLGTGSNYTSAATLHHSRIDVYTNTAPYFLMGRVENADFNGGTNVHSVIVDKLSFEKVSNVAPMPVPPAVSVLSGDQQATLSWGFLYDVDSYKVEVSDFSTGPWAEATNGLSNTVAEYTDTDLVNNQVYYYRVTAFYGAAEALSEVVIAKPLSVVTGPIFATSFKASEGYVGGDLANQKNWVALSGTGANAFEVDAAGDGYADTAPNGATWNTTNGNTVYWSSAMSNGVNATWSGTVDFQLSAVAFPGAYKTNAWYEYDIVEGITNSIATNEVVRNIGTAQNQNFIALDLALTLSDADPLDVNDTNQVNLCVQSRSAFGLRTAFNSAGNNRALNTAMEPEKLGWDPAWSNPTNLLADGPDFESDRIRLTYTIQKTAGQDFYVAFATLSNLVTGAVSSNDGTNPSKVADWWEYEKPGAYAAPLLRFAMGKSKLADGTQNPGDVAVSSELDVKIDSVSLTHSNGAAPLLFPPSWSEATPVASSSTANELTWQSGMSATEGYVVLRSLYDGGPYATNAVVSNATSYVDTDVNDVWTYYYVLRSYQGAFHSANSSQESGTIIPVSSILKLGGTGSTYANLETQNKPKLDNTDSGTTLSNITVRSGIFIENGNPATLQSMGTLDNTLRGYIQTHETDYNRSRVFNRIDPQLVKYELSGGTATNSAILTYVLASEMDDPDVVAAGEVDLTAAAYEYALSMNNFSLMDNATTGKYARALVRQDSTWYVSEAYMEDASVLSIADIGNAATNWLTLDITPVDTFWTALGQPVVNPTLDHVDAIGWYIENGKVVQVLTLSVSAQNASAISEYKWWGAEHLLLDDDMASDPDGDGALNLLEFGLNGDPNNPADTGVDPELDVVNVGGTNYMQYVHLQRIGDNLGVDYSIKDTYNLVYIPITNETEIAAQYMGDYDESYETVTNLIPAEGSVKFLRLELEEL
ncbi:hypothetical protein PDESU_04885 [Pontiella desulfatans]|uniref:Fibronectin type-III domain-containing protein n=1 Tax=Pontiella desulfatans TaxID=2750659 RepID=A0A6C2UA81_PONDE|nr:fibronectin type III domain-containing protein [Pontiella desulfatans]VGO16294.1 hypothetical protein PDESU_04885 [Pontiella desulfatans]